MLSPIVYIVDIVFLLSLSVEDFVIKTKHASSHMISFHYSIPPFQVADFGLSKIKRNTLVSGGVRGTLPWMAPELLNGSSNKVSEKV